MATRDGISDVFDMNVAGQTSRDFQPAAGDTWSVDNVSYFVVSNSSLTSVKVGLYDGSTFAPFYYNATHSNNDVKQAVGANGSVMDKIVCTNTNYIRVQATTGGQIQISLSGIKIVD